MQGDVWPAQCPADRPKYLEKLLLFWLSSNNNVNILTKYTNLFTIYVCKDVRYQRIIRGYTSWGKVKAAGHCAGHTSPRMPLPQKLVNAASPAL